MGDLTSLFELDTLDDGLFRTRHTPDVSRKLSLYGGLVMGQALRAAGMTVPPDRRPHSLHAYFLRPGRVDRPVDLHVDRDRDGGSFLARHVQAVQDDKAILSMLTSFHAAGSHAQYDAVPTQADSEFDEHPSRLTPLMVEVREVTPTRVADSRMRHSDHMWVRVAAKLPDDPLVHACGVVYASDLGSGFGQVEIDGRAFGGPSLDHSVWFHEPIRADEWMLLDLRPCMAADGRGLYQGSLRDRAGMLGAVVAQEMLLRDQPLRPEVLRQMAGYLGLDPVEDRHSE